MFSLSSLHSNLIKVELKNLNLKPHMKFTSLLLIRSCTTKINQLEHEPTDHLVFGLIPIIVRHKIFYLRLITLNFNFV